MFKKTIIATALALTSLSAVAHPVNEEHTIENLARHYNVEMPAPVVVEKEVIVEKEVVKEVPNGIFDYYGGNLSINNIIAGSDDTLADVNYAELEGWFGIGNVHNYGFFDINDDGSIFYKLNPKWFVGGGKTFVNYTQTQFQAENGMKSTDHYAGAGYRFSKGTTFVDASLNLRRSDNEFSGTQGNNGYAILMNGNHVMGEGWSIGGWTDVKMNQDEAFSNSSYEIRGNIGLRKELPMNTYIRVAPHFYKDEHKDDLALHTQIGLTF